MWLADKIIPKSCICDIRISFTTLGNLMNVPPSCYKYLSSVVSINTFNVTTSSYYEVYEFQMGKQINSLSLIKILGSVLLQHFAPHEIQTWYLHALATPISTSHIYTFIILFYTLSISQNCCVHVCRSDIFLRNYYLTKVFFLITQIRLSLFSVRVLTRSCFVWQGIWPKLRPYFTGSRMCGRNISRNARTLLLSYSLPGLWRATPAITLQF